MDRGRGWIASSCVGMPTDLHVRGNICCHINFNYSAESLKQHGTIPLVCPGTPPKGRGTSSRKIVLVDSERFTGNYAPIKIGFSERVLLTNAGLIWLA